MTPSRHDTLVDPLDPSPDRAGTDADDDERVTRLCEVAAAKPHADPSVTITDVDGAPTRNHEPALAPGTMIGDYRIERELGRGGMGIVYAAEHPVIGKRVAIKVLRRSLCELAASVQRFVDEARIVNRIGHANIVDVFAIGVTDCGCSYLVMERLEGETLRERLARSRPSLGETRVVVRTLAAALEAAHQHGVIHRDLKPDNVFLVGNGDALPHVKLLDFGVAKLANDHQRLDLTETGAVVGTPRYIAPEQARGFGLDHRADIYALGCIWYEMLTGRPPFVASNAAELITQHVFEVPPRTRELVPDVLPEIDDVVMRMLSKAPSERPSLAEVVTAIDRVLARPASQLPRAPAVPALAPRAIEAPVVVEARPVVVEPRPAPRRRRGPSARIWIASICLFVASGVAGFLVASRFVCDKHAATMAAEHR